jgi:phosphoglycolate phosphatase-like HAD superfamily hydrolase
VVDGAANRMQALAEHFAQTRRAHPDDQLLIVFDLDGTIVDQRFSARQLLLDYDRVHGTDHFRGLEAGELDDHEAPGVERVLFERGLPAAIRRTVLEWFDAQRFQSVNGIDRARPGVLEVISWFQLQPATSVGVTTTRPARMRDETIQALSRLGKELRAEFDEGLLHMTDGDDDRRTVLEMRREALRTFTRNGYRTFAVVDSDSVVLQALAQTDHGGEILFLQAHEFDLTALIAERDLPEHLTLVWHGVNDEDNLRQFLSSPVTWAECDVRRDPRGRLVLRHDSFEETPWSRHEQLLALSTAVAAIAGEGRCIKLDLKEGLEVLPDVVAVLDANGVADDQLWFNARVEVLGAGGFAAVRSRYPEAVVQCPVDFLGPLMLAAPEHARSVLHELTTWGIDRFSVGWGRDHTWSLLERLAEWGYSVNVYAIPDHGAFLRAVLLLPDSLTADFNFPAWNYFGRGSGERRSTITRPQHELATLLTTS